MLLFTALLGFAGAAVHETYERVLLGVAGGVIRMVEPHGQDTLLTAVDGGVRVDPPYAGMDPFVVRSVGMHVSAPLILALLLVGGPAPIGPSRRAARVAVGALLVFAVHVVALITQLELTPLKEAGFREPSYYVFRFSWWMGTVWSMLVLPAGALLYVYLADFRPMAQAASAARRGRPMLLVLGAVGGAVILLAAMLAHLRPQLAAESTVAVQPDAALVAFRAGRFAEAVEGYQAQLQDASGNPGARFNLAVSLYRTGRFAEAIQQLNLLRSVQPDYPGLDLSLGAALFDLGEREQGLEALRRADLQHETDVELLLQVGDALSGGRELEGAQRAYMRVLELDPESAEALYRLGTLVMAQGRGEQAVQYFQQAVGGRADFLEALKALAVAQQQAGRPAEALAAYRKAVDLAPEDQEVLSGVALLLLRSENPCRARLYLDRCVEAAGVAAETQRCRQLLQQIEASCPA